jgi:iron complex transport system ATP-binding protein
LSQRTNLAWHLLAVPLLSLEAVTAGYGRRTVLRSLSLALDEGERVALVGPNGAGKTTLLRVAGGVLRPASGRVVAQGRDLAATPPRQAALAVSGVAQDEPAEFAFTVRESVALGRVARLRPWTAAAEEDRAAVEDALGRLDLREVADRPVPTLSGGERRRVALARCLAQDARVLLLDEPTAHLDLGHEVALLSLLRSLARERGKAVLAALHDLNLASLFADRVVLLVAGSVVAQGPPSEVLTAERVEAALGARAAVLAHPTAGVPVVLPEGL